MKRTILVIMALCMAVLSNAQDLPYSKYLNYSKSDFRENNFKYHENTNTWYLQKTNGLNTTLNILAIIADAHEDIRPSSMDYSIIVQLGRNDVPSFVRVIFYNDDTYHKLLTFVKRNCQDIIDVSSGKVVKHQTYYGDYSLELKMEHHNISRTSAHTADSKTVKNVDESYNEYEFIIRTGVDPWSKKIDKYNTRQEKRDEKGKKKQNVEDMM